tara:strand:- start:5042 stop:5941 length:900 start_codon:yes stop_codon:yes gene_type:complete
MTVTYHGEDYSARAGQNDTGTRSYTRVFKLETSLKSEDVFDVGSHASLPLIGSAYPRDPFAYCTSLKVDCVGGWKQWTVSASYKVIANANENEPPEANPSDDPPTVTFSSEIYQEPVFRDINDEGIMNSAGAHFADPSPMRDAAHLIIKVKKNISVVPGWCLSYQNSVNNGQFTMGGLAVAEQLARLSRIEVSDAKIRGDYRYYELAFELHIHRDGWRQTILDAGLMQKDPGVTLAGIAFVPDPTKRVPCVDADGQAVTSPVALDGSGSQLANPSPGTAQYKEFQIYPEVDFSILPGAS